MESTRDLKKGWGFDCEKQGLSKIEKGICNGFYTLRGVRLNVMFEYVMNFVWSNEQNLCLKKQLQWLKNRNIKCNNAETSKDLLDYLYRDRSSHRRIARSDRQITASNARASKPQIGAKNL